MNTEQVTTIIENVSYTQSQTDSIADNLKGELRNLPFFEIANKVIDGAALATTALDYQGGRSLATHIPLYTVFLYNSGTLGICVATMSTSLGAISGATALLNLSASNTNFLVPTLPTALPNSGNISITIGTASAGASSFSVHVFGVARIT